MYGMQGSDRELCFIRKERSGLKTETNVCNLAISPEQRVARFTSSL